MAIMSTLKNKKREFFYSWRGNLASEPSEDEGTACRKKAPRNWRRNHAQNKGTWMTKISLLEVQKAVRTDKETESEH